MSQDISPRTTIFYIWHHLTLQSASHHHFTPPHLKAQHIPRHCTVHVSHHSTSATIPHHTHIQHHRTFHTTTIFHIALHHHILILHHWHHRIWHHNTLHIIFHIWRHTTVTQHLAYATFFITLIPHHISHHWHRKFPHLALCNIPHTRTLYSTPRHIPYHTFCISVTFHITPCLKLQHSTPRTHFTSHHNSHQITPHLGTPFHIMPTLHLAPRHAHRHIKI